MSQPKEEPIRGWINANARKPDADSIVLIACQNDAEPVWVGWYDDNCWRCIDGMPVEVSHWMSLPEPPAIEAACEPCPYCGANAFYKDDAVDFLHSATCPQGDCEPYRISLIRSEEVEEWNKWAKQVREPRI